MLDVKLILCPIDFSEFSINAYQHALSLAEHYRAKLVAVHVVELFQHSYLGFAASALLYDEACHALRESSNGELQEFVVRQTPKQIQSEIVVDMGSAPDSILAIAKARKADAIVMGTHGRRGYDRLVLGSVTERVMRTASCPVLVVSKPAHDSVAARHGLAQPRHLGQVLFCADFYKNSKEALRYALSVRAEYDAELTLLHVFEDTPSSETREAIIASATGRLDGLIPAGEPKTPKLSAAVRFGKPYLQIIEFAQEKRADMVVMGARGRGELDVAVFGSTTYRVIQLGTCPVLVVPN
ncbi:MAG: universal stress protein [Candidatus Sulfotelmatobacter sp.]